MHRSLRRFLVVSFILALIAPALLSTPVALAVEPQPFNNGFETDMTGWVGGTRVASGTDGISSADGSWHAEANGDVPFTNWYGYTDEFPYRGYMTEIDIYLNVDGGWANDRRFDWDVASSRSNGEHLRDFVFNAGFYNDATGPGGGTNRFVISASNNAFRPNSNPKNPAREPIAISESGWYTFRHRFSNVGGVLTVYLTIFDPSGTPIKTWELSDPSDTIGTVAGGNRYGWIATNEFSTFAFDNSTLELVKANTLIVDDDGTWGVGGCDGSIPAHQTIQAAVDTAAAGDIIEICPGTYTENLLVNKHVTLDGAGNGTDESIDTIIQGSGSGDGITLTAGGVAIDDRLEIRDLRVQGFSRGIYTDSTISFITFDNLVVTGNASYGIEIHNNADVHHLRMNDVVSSFNTIGMRVRGELTSLDVTGGHFDNNSQGFNSTLLPGETKPFNGADFSGTTFNNNTLKGIYLEKANSVTFLDIQVDNSGTSGDWSAGIDINLKYDDYADIGIVDSEITNSGTGDTTNGVGLTIKARDDGSYSADPATLANVDIFDNLFSGNQNGIRIGEPGKDNAGPTDVEIDDSDIVGNLGFGVENVSQSLVDATCNWWGAADGPSGVASGSGDAVSDNVLFFPWQTNSGDPGCETTTETPPEVVTCLNSITGSLREVDEPSDCGRRETPLMLDNTGADGGKILACLSKYNHRMRIVETIGDCRWYESLVAWNQGTGDDPQIHACVNQYTGYFRVVPSPANCSARFGYVLSWDNPGTQTPRPGTRGR